jgi:hypothetical protein
MAMFRCTKTFVFDKNTLIVFQKIVKNRIKCDRSTDQERMLFLAFNETGSKV